MDTLACPACRGELKFSGESDDRRLISGELACAGCGLVFPVEDEVPELVPPGVDYGGAIWDGMEADTARLVPEWVPKNFEKAVGRSQSPLMREFIDEVRAVEGPVIDIASGPGGSFCIDVMKEGDTDGLLVMSDLGRPVMKAWQRQLRDVGWADSCSFMVFDARKMPFKSESIPMFTSVGGLNSICGNQRLAYEETARVLRPDGRLLDIIGMWEEGGSNQTQMRERNCISTWAEYEALLCGLGLTIERWPVYSTSKMVSEDGVSQREEVCEWRLVFVRKKG